MQGEPRPHPGLSDRPGRGAAGGSSRRAPARLACGVSKVCLACELRRCPGSAVRHQMVRVPAPAISQLRPGLRLACPARPVIGLQGRRAARAAARGRSAAPRQPAAPAGLGRPRSRRRADPAPAASAAYVPAGHPRAPSCAGTAGACDFCVRTRFGQPRRPNGWACLRPAATAAPHRGGAGRRRIPGPYLLSPLPSGRPVGRGQCGQAVEAFGPARAVGPA